MQKDYDISKLILDFILTIVTGGLWLIWILICYLRKNS